VCVRAAGNTPRSQKQA